MIAVILIALLASPFIVSCLPIVYGLGKDIFDFFKDEVEITIDYVKLC